MGFFINPDKPIPQDYYMRKNWPGVVSWNDGLYVHLGMGDRAFTQKVNRKLKRHLTSVSKQVRTIVCAVHHVPFRQLLRTNYTSTDIFLTAFSGSAETGEIIQSFPKVKYVFCGHTHQKKKAKIGDITAVNIGSDYLPSTQMLRSLERGSIGRRIAKYTNAPTVRSWVLGLRKRFEVLEI